MNKPSYTKNKPYKKFTFKRAEDFFVWNGECDKATFVKSKPFSTLVGKGLYYGFYGGRPFITDGVCLKNGAILFSEYKNGNKKDPCAAGGTWVDRFHQVSTYPLATAIDKAQQAVLRERKKALDKELDLSSRGEYHSMRYIPQRKHNKVIA